MQPPPGYEPSLTSLLENASPTSILSSALQATATPLPSIGVDIPSVTLASIIAITTVIDQPTTANISPPSDNGECRLLGPFAIFVQGALGCLALLALVYKRWKERPQRPLKVWSFDVSKQVVGSVLVHVANLLMSMLSSGQFSIKLDASSVSGRGLGLGTLVAARDVDASGRYRPNPCSFYLLNLAIDTTVGIPILIILLRILTAFFLLTPLGSPPQSIRSGNYGSPPQAFWWVKQSLIYFIGLMGMKICVLIMFLLAPWISRVGDWALSWTEGNEALQVIFVMLVFPLIMNGAQYYIIDSFIKNQKPDGHERIPEEDEDDMMHDGAYEDPPSGSSDEIHSSDEADEEVLAKTDDEGKARGRPNESAMKMDSRSGRRSPKKPGLQTGSKDYDPMYDGDSSATVVGSVSTSEGERPKHTTPT